MENYEEGKYYEGLGKYLGIIKVYPYGVDYIIREHRFAESESDGRLASKINTIEIDRIKRD